MFEFWYLLPLGLAVATVAVSAGISGSNFWLPAFLLLLTLPPKLAFWLALITMVFGSSSGVLRNVRAGTLDVRLAARLMLVALPAAVLGSLVSAHVDDQPLLLGFAVIAAMGGVEVLRSSSRPPAPPRENPQRVRLAAAAGGLLQGLVVAGCGVVLMPTLLRHRRDRPEVLVGTSVLVVFACAVTAALSRLDATMLAAIETHHTELWHALPFAASGVVIGGQLGPRLAQRLRLATLERYFGVLLLLVSALVITLAFSQ